MSDEQSIGDFIRDRRLALGYSAGQLAMRLGSTAAIVRSWERDQADVPSDALAGLAELLTVDVAELKRRRPEKPSTPEPVEEPKAEKKPATSKTADKPARTEATAAKTGTKKAAATEQPAETERNGDEGDPSVGGETVGDGAFIAVTPSAEPEGADAPEMSPAQSKPQGRRRKAAPQPPAEPVTAGVGHSADIGLSAALLDAPTEALPPVTARPAATATHSRRPATATIEAPPTRQVEPDATEVDGSVPQWLGPFAIIFDPTKPYLYWARWIGTLIGLVIVYRLARYAGGELIDAVGKAWDSFRTPDGLEVGDSVESLGRLLFGI